jgi:hypothetical protein
MLMTGTAMPDRLVTPELNESQMRAFGYEPLHS